MFRPRSPFLAKAALAVLLAIPLAGCHSYEPLPVDLLAHAASFAGRLPDLPASTGLFREQGRLVAKTFHPDARLARQRARIATVQRDEAGRWVDPRLGANLQRILETVPYEWIASAQLQFTLPINGRLDKERGLAARRLDQATLAAWAIEQQVANLLDRAWIAWSAAQQRVLLFDILCDSLTDLERIAYGLVDAGNLTRPGARIFRLERVQRETERTLMRAQLQVAALTVKQRLGLHPDAPVELQADLSVTPFVTDSSPRRAALKDSPRLLELQLAHATAEADLDLQVRLQFPDLQLSPGWQEEDAEPRAGIGLQLPLPIFAGNDPEIARAAAERARTAEALRCGQEQLLQELALAEQRLTMSRDQQRLLRDSLVPLTTEQLEDGNRLAEFGQFDPLLILDALVRAHDVRMALLAAAENEALAVVDINDLLADPSASPTTNHAGSSR